MCSTTRGCGAPTGSKTASRCCWSTRPTTSTTTNTPGLWRKQVRKIPGEVALQIRRDSLRDPLSRKRLEWLQFQDVAGHHDADQLRGDELDPDHRAARGTVNTRPDRDCDHFLDERAEKTHLGARQYRPQRGDETRTDLGIPQRQ